MIKVAVLGARGRMGAEVVAAVEAAADCQLVATLDLGDSLDQLIGGEWSWLRDEFHPIVFRLLGLHGER